MASMTAEAIGIGSGSKARIVATGAAIIAPARNTTSPCWR